MIPPTTQAPAPKRKADVLESTLPLAVSRKRNLAAPPAGSHWTAAEKIQTPSDLFFATHAQFQSSRGVRAENTEMTVYFCSGDTALRGHQWSLAEQYYAEGRRLAGLSFLKEHLRARRDGLEPTMPCRSWLLYQVGMAELDKGTPSALNDARAHLRASQALCSSFYPASVALGVCHILLGQTKDGEAALRHGLWSRMRTMIPGIEPSVRAHGPSDAPALLGLVVGLVPTWATAKRACLEAHRAQAQQREIDEMATRAAAQYANVSSSSISGPLAALNLGHKDS